MTPNELLLWLSARKEGSWLQFRTAVDSLELAERANAPEEDASLPVHQRIRYNLERLGHLEFDASGCEDGWRVVPPALAISQYANKTTGVLCGARTPKLLERIERAANGLTFERVPVGDCPDVIYVRGADAEPILRLAQEEGILCQFDTPTALLSSLPRIDSVTDWRNEPLPAVGRDWDVKQFVIEKRAMKWRTVTLQEANAPAERGLFRFTLFQKPRYFLREGDKTVTLPGAVGKYYILFRRKRRVLKYDRSEGCLSLPAIFRPPPLTERALILCSGFPPSVSMMHGRRRLTYRDVPEEVAGMVGEVLKQDLL
jgi:hypothetical protein